jgi:hypothetical protein
MTEPVSRGVYITVAVIAAVPLLVLSAAAPLGELWRWQEFPRHVTLVAVALGIATTSARSRPAAMVVPIGTAAIAVVWELVRDYRGASAMGHPELFGTELNLTINDAIGNLAPWLLGSAYGALAWLAIARVPSPVANRRRAGAWLAVIGGVVMAFALSTHGWLTLENLRGDGTYHSGVAWPDTKVLTVVAGAIACAIGLVLALRREPPPIPPARVV